MSDPESRYFVTVDISAARGGDLAHVEQFKHRHLEAAIANLPDGAGISFYVPVFVADEDAARKRVLAWAQEVFASPRYEVSIRSVEHSPI